MTLTAGAALRAESELQITEPTHPALKWGPFVQLAPATRSYTISGLAAQPYEVVIRNKDFGGKIVTGTPLP